GGDRRAVDFRSDRSGGGTGTSIPDRWDSRFQKEFRHFEFWDLESPRSGIEGPGRPAPVVPSTPLPRTCRARPGPRRPRIRPRPRRLRLVRARPGGGPGAEAAWRVEVAVAGVRILLVVRKGFAVAEEIFHVADGDREAEVVGQVGPRPPAGHPDHLAPQVEQ